MTPNEISEMWMRINTDRSLTNQLQGGLDAVVAVLAALVRASPDPRALLDAAEGHLDTTQATAARVVLDDLRKTLG